MIKIKTKNTHFFILVIFILSVVVIIQQIFIHLLVTGLSPDEIFVSTTNYKLSNLQINSISSIILQNTPEYTHVGGNPNYKWVLLEVDSNTTLKEIYLSAKEKLSKRYTVFNSKTEIPEHYKEKFDTGDLDYYKSGFVFSYRVRFLDKKTIKIDYCDFEGSLSASSHYKIYKWDGKDWVIKKIGTMVIS